MQFAALFALLPLMAHAAPIVVGVPGVVQLSILQPSSSATAQATPVFNLISSVSALAANPTGLAGGLAANAGVAAKGASIAVGSVVGTTIPSVVASAAGKLPAPISSAASALSGAVTGINVGKVDAAASAVVTGAYSVGAAGISAAANNVVAASINSALIQATGTVSAAVGAINTGLPSDLFTKTNTYISGLKPISVTQTVVDLEGFVAQFEADLKAYVTNIKNNVEVSGALQYLALTIKNLDAYLKSLPDYIARDQSVIKTAGSVDKLLSDYVTLIQQAGLSLTTFLNALYLVGLGAGSTLSTLLTRFAAIFPPGAFATITAGL